jgi:cyclase
MRRVIACLDVMDGRVVKGAQFVGLRDVGDPVELAMRYEAAGADEIVFLDITATTEARATLLSLARRTAERLFIPLTLGGGIRSAGDMSAALRAGADKVALNSAAVRRPELLTECAVRFGERGRLTSSTSRAARSRAGRPCAARAICPPPPTSP